MLVDLLDYFPGVKREKLIMVRPPLPIGTAGRIRTYRTPSGWRSRTTYRDYDGVTREVEMHGRTKAAAERRLATALRDRAYAGGGAELNPDSRVSALAEAWYADAEDRGLSRPPWRPTGTSWTGTFSLHSAMCGCASSPSVWSTGTCTP